MSNGQGPQPNGKSFAIFVSLSIIRHTVFVMVIYFLGKKPQNGGGVGRTLMPSKGNSQFCPSCISLLMCMACNLMSFSGVGHAMGAQNGYRGYPTKGLGEGSDL